MDVKHGLLCRILAYHSGGYGEFYVLRYKAAESRPNSTDVSGKYFSSMSVDEQAKQENMKQAASIALLRADFLLGVVLDPEDGGEIFL
jgi:hypothetical protein